MYFIGKPSHIVGRISGLFWFTSGNRIADDVRDPCDEVLDQHTGIVLFSEVVTRFTHLVHAPFVPDHAPLGR